MASNPSSNSRKILVDDYTGRMYAETVDEALRRKCREHEKLAIAFNKCVDNGMRLRHRQASDCQRLFDTRQNRERSDAIAGLREMTSHRIVLECVRRRNDRSLEWDDRFGRYGQGHAKAELQPRIDSCKRRLTGSYVRQREATRLLKQRRPMHVVDRRLDTFQLLRQWTKHGDMSDNYAKASALRPLPPIGPGGRHTEDHVVEDRRRAESGGGKTFITAQTLD